MDLKCGRCAKAASVLYGEIVVGLIVQLCEKCQKDWLKYQRQFLTKPV